MSDFVFKLNHEGVGELLKSAEMAAVIDEFTDREAADAGGEGHIFIGRTRVHGWITGIDEK